MEGLLSAYGYPFKCVDGFDYRFHIRTADGTWRTQVQCYEAAKMIWLYTYLNDRPFPPSRITFIREVVEGLNGTIVAGRFVWDRGQVRYENGIDFHDRRRSSKAVERALKAAAFPLALWTHCISLIDKPRVNARSAVNYALLMEDAVEDPKLITPETMKIALKVVDGGETVESIANMPKPPLTLVT